ncbi:hypothetical protein RHECNPAF_3340057 [Rhizobium etli CNPAF512]|nr:hypothetical protein RHECNPAF_3340057 [Rhizobium etli CNPAF512]
MSRSGSCPGAAHFTSTHCDICGGGMFGRCLRAGSRRRGAVPSLKRAALMHQKSIARPLIS